MTTNDKDTVMQPEEPIKGPFESESMETATATEKEVLQAEEVELQVVVVETDKGEQGDTDKVMEDVESPPSAPTEQEKTMTTTTMTTTAPLEKESEPDTTTPFDTDAEIQSIFKSMESLRASMSEVVAFPTEANYTRLLLRAKNAHRAMEAFSYSIESGDSSLLIQEASPSFVAVLDPGSRSKLNAFGTNYWNIIQKHPELFMDTVTTTTTTTTTYVSLNEKKEGGEDDTVQVELERSRGAASGFIRALSCRLILIGKLQTKDRNIPTLVKNTVKNGDNHNNGNASCGGGAGGAGAGVADFITQPLALSSEMEFGLKCFCRAGRAILAHSEEYNVAYSILSLAVVCWEGIQLSFSVDASGNARMEQGGMAIGIGIGVGAGVGDYTCSEAFDALLLLPDCAAKMVTSHGRSDVGKELGEDLEGGYHDTSESVIATLQRLEEFVYERLGFVDSGGDVDNVSNGEGSNQSLFAMQHYLPSLARIGYKHGNRFARLQDYNAAQEALRISLTATDKCLAKMSKEKAIDGNSGMNLSRNREHALHALEIQEQEMQVVSKQSFHVLSHVCRSVKKFEEAKQCLDRIEAYLDEQRKHDDELYNQTMSQLTSRSKALSLHSSSSTFALEGPQKQDAEEIKSRARVARDKARLGEATERVNLAFSRIDLLHKSCVVLTTTDHTFIDDQFKTMVECSKKFVSGYSGELRCASASNSKCNDRVGVMFRTILGAARTILSRRFASPEEEMGQLNDPYEVFIASLLDDNPAQVSVYLEALHTTIMSAKSARDIGTDNSTKLQTGLDQRAIGMGKKLSGMLHSLRNAPTFKANNNTRSDSSLFSNHAASKISLEPLFETARDYCTKAVSIYQGLEECADQTFEWCEILIDVLQIWRKVNLSNNGGTTEEQCDKVIAGVMAIKAHAESMSGSYGSALNTARGAFEKDGAHLGTLVTLFQISMRYESFTHSDSMTDEENQSAANFSNTLLELDNAIDVHLSLSKLDNLDGVQSMENLLEVFSLMCKLALDHDLLLLGLQRRMIDLATKVASLTLPSRFDTNLPVDFVGKGSCYTTIFGVLRAYLATFEELLPSFIQGVIEKGQVDEFHSLQIMLGGVLDLLILVRDSGKNHTKAGAQGKFDFDFDDSPSFLDRTEKDAPTANTEADCIFDLCGVGTVVGTQSECLWIAEQLWNISNHVMTAVVPVEKKSYAAEFVAGCLRDAHDFALISEEEKNAFLTKGYLARESFHFHTTGCIDFLSNEMGSDLCSEFSAQCLLSAVANVIDAINCEKSESIKAIEISKCLVAAMAELRTLEMMGNEEVHAATAWLSLNVLIAVRDDESCVIALTDGGLYDKLTSILNNFDYSSGEKGQFTEMPPVDQLFLLANQAQRFGMQSSAKHLFLLCGDSMSKAKKAFVVQEDFTIGLVQRNIIALSSTVEEVVKTFDSVDRTMKDADLNGSYTAADIDYFVVEAHNRACSLTFIGDAPNAEKLLTVAMNLLPHASKAVESFGSAIRRTYRSVIGRKGVGGGALTLSAGDLVSLFEK